MKTLVRNLIVLGSSVLALGGTSIYAAENPAVVQQAQTVVVTTVDNVLPAPTPTPTPVVIVVPTKPQAVAPVVQPPVLPSPTPTEVEFPPVQPTATTTVNPGLPQATVVPVPVPQTAVFISVTCPPNQACSDPVTGGIRCVTPCAITFQANFQGGFPGISPTFKWSDGATENPHVITFTQAGTPHVTVVAYEVYQGQTYKVGSANSIPITVS